MGWDLNGVVNVATLGTIPDITGSTAASNARDAEIAAGQNANALQLDIYNRNTANEQPYMDAGKSALNQLQTGMPDLTRQFSANDFHADPGYQFALNQGMQAIQRSAAAKGSLNSVGTMQNLNNYAQGMADQQYENAYNRFTANQQQRYNMLAGLSGTGLTATNALGGVSTNYANQVSGNLMGMGNANAAAAMAPYNNMMGLIKSGATVGAAALA